MVVIKMDHCSPPTQTSSSSFINLYWNTSRRLMLYQSHLALRSKWAASGQEKYVGVRNKCSSWDNYSNWTVTTALLDGYFYLISTVQSKLTNQITFAFTFPMKLLKLLLLSPIHPLLFLDFIWPVGNLNRNGWDSRRINARIQVQGREIWK